MPSSEVMHKWKTGKLKSGGSGKVVKSQKQAEAIMFSERANEAAHGGTYESAPERKTLKRRG
jgi:hypothetical protein